MPLYWLRPKCFHRCACGAELRCACAPDSCHIGTLYVCDNCIDRQLDAYLTQLELASERRQESRREPQQPHR